MNGCPLCGESLHEIVYPVIVPGKPARVHVTCWNKNCPIEGRTLSRVDLFQLAEQTRQDIFLTWSFDACLSRPCPATLTAALTLLYEVSSVARFKEVRRGYCKFVRVSWLLDLNAAAEALMQRCVTINGADTVNGCVR